MNASTSNCNEFKRTALSFGRFFKQKMSPILIGSLPQLPRCNINAKVIISPCYFNRARGRSLDPQTLFFRPGGVLMRSVGINDQIFEVGSSDIGLSTQIYGRSRLGSPRAVQEYRRPEGRGTASRRWNIASQNSSNSAATRFEKAARNYGAVVTLTAITYGCDKYPHHLKLPSEVSDFWLCALTADSGTFRFRAQANKIPVSKRKRIDEGSCAGKTGGRLQRQGPRQERRNGRGTRQREDVDESVRRDRRRGSAG